MLREKYTRELKKKKKKKSGDGAKFVKEWELMDHLDFLKEFIKHRK